MVDQVILTDGLNYQSAQINANDASVSQTAEPGGFNLMLRDIERDGLSGQSAEGGAIAQSAPAKDDRSIVQKAIDAWRSWVFEKQNEPDESLNDFSLNSIAGVLRGTVGDTFQFIWGAMAYVPAGAGGDIGGMNIPPDQARRYDFSGERGEAAERVFEDSGAFFDELLQSVGANPNAPEYRTARSIGMLADFVGGAVGLGKLGLSGAKALTLLDNVDDAAVVLRVSTQIRNSPPDDLAKFISTLDGDTYRKMPASVRITLKSTLSENVEVLGARAKTLMERLQGFDNLEDFASPMAADWSNDIVSQDALKAFSELNRFDFEDLPELLQNIRGDNLSDAIVKMMRDVIEEKSSFFEDAADVRVIYSEFGRIVREASPEMYRGLDGVSDSTIGKLSIDFGISPDDTLYRATPREFVNADGTVSPNPDSAGIVRDTLNSRRRGVGRSHQRAPEIFVAGEKAASRQPGLFFGTNQIVAKSYQDPDMVVIGVSVRDLLEAASESGNSLDFLSDAAGMTQQSAVFVNFDFPVRFTAQ